MPNPTLNWRLLTPVVPAANTVAAWLDAVHTALTATTYNDGSARTPGSGSAWTATRNRWTTTGIAAGFGQNTNVAAVTASSFIDTRVPANAIDNTAAVWHSSNPPLPHWLKIEFTSARVIKAYGISTSGNTMVPDAWQLQGSNDNTNWTTLDSRGPGAWGVVSQSFTASDPYSCTVFKANNSTAYLYYRLNITGTISAQGYTNITEFVLLEDSANAITEAVIATPPLSTAINQRVILSGRSQQYYYLDVSPTMTLNDGFSLGNLMVGINLDSGSFNSWNAALPFTSGRFSGYARNRTLSGFTPTLAYIWESQEGLIIQYVNSAGATCAVVAGALVDPVQAGAAAESDGRVYMIGSSGADANFSTTWLNSTINSIFNHSTAGGGARCVTFQPGVSTRLATAMQTHVSTSATAAAIDATFASRTGLVPAMSIPLGSPTGGNNFVGVLRQIGLSRSMISGLTLAVGGVDVGYSFGAQASPAAASQAVFLPK